MENNLKNYINFLTPDVYLNSDSIVIDIGANVGKYTAIFNKFGSQVYAFEPTKAAFDILNDKFKNNSLVTCYHKACYNKNETIKIYHHEWSDKDPVKWSVGNSIIKEKSNVSENNYEEIPGIDLSEFIFSLNKEIDLIKMDVEGAEYLLINHIIDTGAINKVKILICETHEKKYDIFKKDTIKLKEKIKELNLENKIYLDWR